MRNGVMPVQGYLGKQPVIIDQGLPIAFDLDDLVPKTGRKPDISTDLELAVEVEEDVCLFVTGNTIFIE